MFHKNQRKKYCNGIPYDVNIYDTYITNGGISMDYLVYLAPIGALAALIFAVILALRVKKQDEGTDEMKRISGAIRKGANAYLARQYKGVAIFFAVVFVVLLVLYFVGLMSIFIPFAFVTGGIFSALAGFIGMKIATASNARTANAARKSINTGLRVAFSAGGVMGFVVVGLGLAYISAWYFGLRAYFGTDANADQQIASALTTFGMGASAFALFARVGGGIFTKAADVGADLVGKVEVGIPEDDPRNPAVIADNVGDNVGDVAGMGADLFESYVGAILSCCALAVSANYGVIGMVVPLVLAAIGIFAAIIGSFFVRTKENTSQKVLLGALRRGTWGASAIIAVASYFLIRYTLKDIGPFIAIIVGLVAGVLIGFFTEYFTSDTYKPTKKLAGNSVTGSATIIIGGISLGMVSTVIPVIIVGISIILAFKFSGLYGIGLAAVGMLSTLGITLATDAYGPIADNAGGIAEMAGLEPEVRERTDALDSLGNTTAATGKGFAIGSAALTALALIASFIEQVKIQVPEFSLADINLMDPYVMVGIFVGCMLPFIFAALTMESVGKAAQSIVIEVRRQFKEIVGIMEGTAEPDYAACVNLCTKSAQKEMVLPSVLAVCAPIVGGFFLGVNGVAGMLLGSTVSGFILAIMLSNAGGAWDNAKKHIEAGNFGGKGSDCHKAAVVGDTVGDPFKDTSGPSINILIKLVSVAAIVFLPLIITIALV